MLKFSIVLAFIVSANFSFADVVKNAKRTPASDSIITKVQATGLTDAWRKIVKDRRVVEILKKVRKEYRDCEGSPGRFSEKQAFNYYTGNGGNGQRFVGYLVPFYGGCGGSGLIEEVTLLAKIGVHIDIENEDSETYDFYGFVKVSTIPITAEKQTAFD